MCFSDRVKLNNKSLMTNSLPSKLVFMSESAGDGSVFRILYNCPFGIPVTKAICDLVFGVPTQWSEQTKLRPEA